MPRDQEVMQLMTSAWPWGNTPGGHPWPHECPGEDLGAGDQSPSLQPARESGVEWKRPQQQEGLIPGRQCASGADDHSQSGEVGDG